MYFIIFLLFLIPITNKYLLSRLERARRHNTQTSSNILARILINGKIMADTPAVYDNIRVVIQ